MQMQATSVCFHSFRGSDNHEESRVVISSSTGTMSRRDMSIVPSNHPVKVAIKANDNENV